jgi:hypothetical protein
MTRNKGDVARVGTNMEHIPKEVWIAVGAVIAAFIAATVSLGSLVNTKEKDLVEFRSKWLDSITADLSALLGLVDVITRFVDTRPNTKLDESELAALRKDHKAEYTKLEESYYRVRTRLGDARHAELKKALDSLRAEFFGSCGNLEQIRTRQAEVTDAAERLFSAVWHDIKNGDEQFKRLVRLLKVSIATLTLAFVATACGVYRGTGYWTDGSTTVGVSTASNSNENPSPIEAAETENQCLEVASSQPAQP